jgi:hypothetical protein
MICLDKDLIARALQCITDSASAHDIRGLIHNYELAVDLHNRQWGSHVNYKDRYERELRALVPRTEPTKSR